MVTTLLLLWNVSICNHQLSNQSKSSKILRRNRKLVFQHKLFFLVPSEWKKVKIVPLLKSGNKEELDSYRPISILPILSKILEKAVFHQLHSYLSEK